MTTALFAPLVYSVWKKRSNITKPAVVAGTLLLGGLLTPFAVSLHTRVYEARFVESSKVIDSLVLI